MVKNQPASEGDTGDIGLIPQSGRSSGEGNTGEGTPVFLPGKSHEQRSLMDYSPWGCKESDTTEHTHKHAQGKLRPCIKLMKRI